MEARAHPRRLLSLVLRPSWFLCSHWPHLTQHSASGQSRRKAFIFLTKAGPKWVLPHFRYGTLTRNAAFL